jgi:hypothetical protein
MNSLQNELWKPIPEYENYKISNMGRLMRPNGNIENGSYCNGRTTAIIYKNGKKKTVYFGRMVAILFIENKHNLECVFHINQNRKDNRAENLEWVTLKERTRRNAEYKLKVFNDLHLLDLCAKYDMIPIENHPQYFITKDGRVYSSITNKFLKPNLDKKKKWGGYYSVELWSFDKKYTRQRINRIVATAYIPNPENKEQVNHINGIKTDNRVENLEWCTSKENINHAQRIGLMKSGRSPKKPTIRKTKEEISENHSKKLIHLITGKVYKSAKEAGDELGFTVAQIRHQLRGHNINKSNLTYFKDADNI